MKDEIKELAQIVQRLNDGADRATEAIREFQCELNHAKVSFHASVVHEGCALVWTREGGHGWYVWSTKEGKPLLSASRETRIRSVEVLPALLEAILKEAHRELRASGLEAS